MVRLLGRCVDFFSFVHSFFSPAHVFCFFLYAHLLGPATIPVLNNLDLNTQFTLTPGSQTWSNFIDVRFSGDALFPIAMDLMAGTSPSMEGLGVAKASFQHANDAKFNLQLAVTIPEMVLDV